LPIADWSLPCSFAGAQAYIYGAVGDLVVLGNYQFANNGHKGSFTVASPLARERWGEGSLLGFRDVEKPLTSILSPK
jgi:hypothetical protein